MVDPRRLLVFRAVVRHGSFSAAARALHLTQPSVSRQVAALEAEAGALLLRRAPAGIALTGAGAALLEAADAIAGQLDAAGAALDALRGLEAGVVRLGAFPSAAATIALDACASVRRRHPGIAVSLVESTVERSIAGVRDGSSTSGSASARPTARRVRPSGRRSSATTSSTS